MQYDIIIILGERYFDHPLSGAAIIKRLLEKNGYTVGLIEMPEKPEDVKQLGTPKLFFAISSGSIDSMIRNYTPQKRLRKDDPNLDYDENVPTRATITYSNWVRQHYKESKMVLGGTEATLRRFTHYDYWDNKLRKPILFDSRADIIAYGNAEKQILEIAHKIKNNQPLENIEGTCVISKELPKGFVEMPSFDDVSKSKEKFIDMQNALTNTKDIAQKIDNRYALQYRSPCYTSKDLDEYYELPFTRQIPSKHLRGFEFSVVTHRGCIGKCNFCSLTLTQGERIISRSEESILKEIKNLTKLKHFKGNIDDLGGPSANMYGMDCNQCTEGECIKCNKLIRTNKRLLNLLRKARKIPGIKKVYIRSGVRYDLATPEYINELAKHHISGTLKIAPEHTNRKVLKLMNKDQGDLKVFMQNFKKTGKKLAFYFITAHPGSTMREAEELAEQTKNLENADSVQVFIPTPMTVSTAMYYTALDPKTKKPVYVPYTYSEKKKQKEIIFKKKKKITNFKR